MKYLEQKCCLGIWRNSVRLYVVEETHDLNSATAEQIAYHDYDLHGEETLQNEGQV